MKCPKCGSGDIDSLGKDIVTCTAAVLGGVALLFAVFTPFVLTLTYVTCIIPGVGVAIGEKIAFMCNSCGAGFKCSD